MQRLHYLALFLSASLVVATSHGSNRFILEVDESSSAQSLSTVYSSLKESTGGFKVRKEFVSKIFTGAAVTLNDPKDAITIAKTPGVRAIRPPLEDRKMHIVNGQNDPELPQDMESTHVMTGVDKLHADGIIGSGIKIGIIDTGIDYNHPALGGGLGPGHKVIGGYDFVGDAYNGTNSSLPVPDNDPLDTCNGHGTHVAGIIGANPGNEFNISGVAYGASLTSYRIFGCTGGTPDDIIIEALLKGFEDDQDILTLSLGGPDGWTESSIAVVADRIAASGKIVTISAGNSGDSGSWYSSSPSDAINGISVASVDNVVIPGQTAIVHGAKHEAIFYFSTLPLRTNKTLPVYATSNDTTVTNDACNPLPESTPDLSSFIVILRRGTCTFVQKVNNIAAKGAKFALIYNNVPGGMAIDFGNFSASLIQAADGEFLVRQFAAGVAIELSFPQSGSASSLPNPTGGLMSNFSSYGPSNELYFKPAVAAPGSNILSTFPLALGGFAALSGTSMACPFVAGSSALLLSNKGKTFDVARSARNLFESTAQKVLSNKTEDSPWQTLTQQGAGLINVYDAIHTTTIVSPTELILNDTAYFNGVQTFTVRNDGGQAKTYTLNHVPAGTALTVQPGSIFTALGPVPLSRVAASVELTPSTFTVEPGQMQSVLAVFTPPSDPSLDLSTYPVYSGFIEIDSGSDNTMHVSYLGLLGNLKEKQVIDTTDVFFNFTLPTILNATQAPQLQPTNYTFMGVDYPTTLFRLVFGTSRLTFDLVEATFTTDSISSSSFEGVNVLGSVTSSDYVARNDFDTTSGQGNLFSMFNMTTATFANGTVIPNGSYRILMRALRVTGDPKNEGDYESWLSPCIGIKAKA